MVELPKTYNTGLTQAELTEAFTRARNDYTDAEVETLVDTRISSAVADVTESLTAALAEKADKSPVSIPSGADLNDYTTVGTYVSPSSAITNSLTNKPSGIGGNGFSLEVLRYANYPGVMQRVMWNAYSTYIPHLCVRGGRLVDGSYTFGAWHVVPLTAETEA